MSIYSGDDRLSDLIYIDESTRLPYEYDSDADQSMKVSYIDYTRDPAEHCQNIYLRDKSGSSAGLNNERRPNNMDLTARNDQRRLMLPPALSNKANSNFQQLNQGTMDEYSANSEINSGTKAEGVYYPGPIPRELNLPPILSTRDSESITNLNRTSISAQDTLDDFLTTNVVPAAVQTQKIQEGSLLSISLAQASAKKSLIYDGQKRQTTLLQEYHQLRPTSPDRGLPFDQQARRMSPQRSPCKEDDVPLALRFKNEDNEVLAQRKERLMRQKEDVPLAFVKLRLNKEEMVNQWRTGVD
ncbi:hypothetical protein NEOLI_004345 [Neolecta irregularis DAH-3]|uniref:Uncharacterized protein n=1 Tax=Neolecta irregularis (strain DAH-3) TaxID=1198029 RepID=A0A1U7LKU3_NEOID|nr:hypothetical protein NEOLI_004345 [Neolecta irregularis DAH-3]|eukprot:OLL23213.1 hypothetical protein NEOLI_004345 [Neolecta irregularis DAH-3]